MRKMVLFQIQLFRPWRDGKICVQGRVDQLELPGDFMYRSLGSDTRVTSSTGFRATVQDSFHIDGHQCEFETVVCSNALHLPSKLSNTSKSSKQCKVAQETAGDCRRLQEKGSTKGASLQKEVVLASRAQGRDDSLSTAS